MKSSIIDKVKIWVSKNRFEAFLLASVILLAAYLRLYQIDQYMTFLGDEGRDAIVVRRLLVNFDPILVGPGTSIGNMYLGPLYYYLSAPFLFLFNYSPVGPSVMVALLGIITTFFVWFVSREWFGRLAAFISMLLYASAPVVITYSRSSWNPNIMPFFALLCIYSVWRIFYKYNFKWLILLGISFAFVLNSHYLGLLLVPVIVFFWILTFLKIKKEAASVRSAFIRNSLLGLLAFSILMSPLVIFDARHDWRNFGAIKTFFTVRQETVSIKPWTALPKIYSIWTEISERLLTATKVQFAGFFAVFTALFVFSNIVGNYKDIKNIFKVGKNNQMVGFLLLSVWLITALLGFGVYKQQIYDHYFGFIFPAVFILIGAIFQIFFDKNKFIGIALSLFFVPLMFFNNIWSNTLQFPPNKQLQRTEAISEQIAILSNGREFNFAVIAERNYEGAYQYFLEKNNVPFVIIDAQRSDETIKDQLFVVCEMPAEKCDPTHNAKTEIANFGWSKVEFQKEVEGVIIFKLIHSNP